MAGTMLTLDNGRMFRMPENDERIARTMLGIGEAAEIPSSFINAYYSVLQFLNRSSLTNLSCETIAVICFLSKQTPPAADKMQWLVDAIDEGRIKTGTDVVVPWKGKDTRGMFKTHDPVKRVVVVEIEGDDRHFPYDVVKKPK